MGDAYKSLTIKINANTAGFNQGLENIKSAVRATQQDMRRLNQAARLDPSSMTLARARLEAIEAGARASAAQFSRMEMKMAEAAKRVGGMERLKASMKDISLRTAEAKASYNMLDAELNQFYNHLRDAAAAAKGISLKEAEADVKRVKGDMAQLAALMREAFAGRSTLPFGAKNIDELIAKVRALKGEFNAVDAEHKKLKDTDALKKVAIDAQLAKAQVADLSRQEARAASELRRMGADKPMRRMVSEAKVLDAALEEAAKRASVLDRAMQMNPGSTSVATARMRALAQQARLLEDAIGNAQRRMGSMDTSGIARIEERFRTTGNAVRVYEERLARASAKERELQATLAAMRMSKEPAEEIAKVARRAKATGAAATALKERLDHANDAHSYREAANEVEMLGARLASVQAKASAARGKLGQFGMSVRNFGYSMSATVGAGAVMVGTYSIQAADEIDAAYRNMRKTVNGTEEQFAALKADALEFSQTHFTSADQMLEIEAIGGQLGIAAENLGKFSEVVSSTDIATNLDIETISENFGQLSNIMNDMNQDIQEGPGSLEAYSDALVRLGNNSATQEDKIQNVMMRIAAMGTISGFTTPQLLALSTAVASSGQGAEAAGTAISKTFSNIETAVNGAAEAQEKLKDRSNLTASEIAALEKKVASGEKKLQAFAKVADMSAKDFAFAWNNDPMRAFQAFIEGLKRIDREGGSVDSTLIGLGITAVRQKQALSNLTQMTDVLNNALVMSDDAWNGVSDAWGDAGDAAREAQRKSEGFSGQFQILKNDGQMLAELFTGSLTPAVTGLGDVTRAATEVFANMPEPVRNTVVAVGGLVALSGPMSIFAGSCMSGWNAIGKFMKGSQDVARVVEGADGALTVMTQSLSRAERAALEAEAGVTGLGKAAKGLSGVRLLGIIGGVAAVGTAAAIAWSEYVKWEEWTRKVETAHKSMAEIASEAIGKASQAAKGSTEKYISASDFIDRYKKIIEDAAEANEELASKAEDTYTKVAMTDKYSETVTKYLKDIERGADLSADGFAELTGACAGYTQVTGETISCIQDTDGSVRVLKDGVELTAEAFDRMADAQKRAAQKDLFQETMTKSNETVVEGKKALKDYGVTLEDAKRVEKEIADLEAERTRAKKDWVPSGPGDTFVFSKQKQLDELKESYEKWKEIVETIEAAQKSSESAQELMGLLNSKNAGKSNFLEGLIANNQEALNSFAASEKSVNSFISALRHAGITASELKDVDLEKVIDGWDGSMGSLVSSLQSAGYQFKDNERDLLALQQIKIGDKYYYVDDDGTILTQKGNLSKFNKVQLDDKYYYVSDQGTVYDEEGKLADFKMMTIDDKCYRVYDDGTIRTEEGKLADLASFKIGKKTFYVTDDGSVRDSKGNVVDLKKEMEGVKDKNIAVTASTAAASNNIEAFKRKYSNLSITATLKYKTLYDSPIGPPTKSAAGGMLPRARIFKHADGGYFVDRPTVIGQTGPVTHIAGEAGIEYVAKYANGGVVLPLTNPKMRPWVQAVAAEMSHMGGTGGNVFNISLNYKAADDANKMARDFMRIVSSQLGR